MRKTADRMRRFTAAVVAYHEKSQRLRPLDQRMWWDDAFYDSDPHRWIEWAESGLTPVAAYNRWVAHSGMVDHAINRLNLGRAAR